MRRWIAGAAAGLGLLLAAPAAQADGPQWAGSRVTTSTVSGSSAVAVSAQFIRAYNPNVFRMAARTTFTTPSGLPSGCPAPGTAPVSQDAGYPKPGDKANSTDTRATVTVPCNGTYGFEITATVSGGLQADDVKTLSGTVTVAAPPPDVTGTNAVYDGSTVTITWDPLSNPPPDFTGYRVERQDASGRYVPVATLGPDRTSHQATPPPEGGEVIYRVVALRSGPNGDLASSGGGRAPSVSLPTTTTTTVPGATDVGADGGTAGPGGTNGGTAGTTDGGTAGAGGTGGSGRPRTIPRGITGVGTKAPRLGTPTQQNSGLLLTPDDEGFETEIDYGDQELAGEEGAGDDLLVFDEASGRGLAVPIGIGAVLMGWGLHLFFLARAARPQTMAVPLATAYGAVGYEGDPYDDEDDDLRYGHDLHDDAVDLAPVTSAPAAAPASPPSTGFRAGYRTSTGSGYGAGTAYPASYGTAFRSTPTSYDDYDDGF